MTADLQRSKAILLRSVKGIAKQPRKNASKEDLRVSGLVLAYT